MRNLTEAERDARDLRILRMFDNGMTQKQAAERAGVSRFLVHGLLRDIQHDEAQR